jgi:predicted ATPase
VLTAEDLLRRLTQDVLLATAGPRDLPERQRTINATVAWSYQLLAPDEQRVFRRLGVLPGRFPIEAAAAVLAGDQDAPSGSGEALRALAGLIDKSLLLRAETSVAKRPLYRMLETVRAFAAHEVTFRASARTHWPDWPATARPKRRARRKNCSVLRKPNGWTVCATIWRATARR